MTFEEVAHLERAGYRVRLSTLEYQAEVRFGGVYGAPIEVLPAPGGVRGFLPALWLLLRWLVRVRPRLVIASSVIDCAYLWLPAQLARVPYITHVHGSFFWSTTDRTKYALINRPALLRVLARSPFHGEFVPERAPASGPARALGREATALLYRLGVRRARARLVLSRRTAWEVEELYGTSAVVLKGAFPAELLDRQPGPDPFRDLRVRGPVVLTVSRLEPRKRVDLTVRAFARLLRTLPGATLVIGGTGPSERTLRQLAHELGIGADVLFEGFVPEGEVLDRLWHCDVFVHMNWAEYAIAPLEALALGTKVVWSTEMEMDPELEASGLVYPAEPTPEATAGALAMALRAPVDRAGRRSLERYTWERYFARVVTLVDAIARP